MTDRFARSARVIVVGDSVRRLGDGPNGPVGRVVGQGRSAPRTMPMVWWPDRDEPTEEDPASLVRVTRPQTEGGER